MSSAREPLLLVLCAVMMITAGVLFAVGAGVATAAGGSSGSSAECTTVTHDSFRVSNSTLAELNETGSATVTEKNVRVSLEETESFVRVRAQNPNGYCVRVVLEISEQAVTPAELGNVEAAEPKGSELDASWSAMHSLQDDELYTEVTFELPAGSPEVLFAPSKLRVKSLSWTGEAKGEANSTLGKLRDAVGISQDLEQNTYQLHGNESGDIITVGLQSSDGREVEEWHALYETESGDWAPVEKETDKPVFYTETGDTVKFHYNDPTTVKFVANPGWRDKASYDLKSYSRSVGDVLEAKLPFALLPGGELTI